jgi:hypothetical protein
MGKSLLQYRNFVLGSDVASVAALASVDRAETKTQALAVLQDLQWKPSRWDGWSKCEFSGSGRASSFSFTTIKCPG